MTARTDKVVGALEILALCSLFFWAVWGPGASLATNGWAPAISAGGILAAIYALWISPRLIHHDPNAVRGFGSWKTAFIRTDNLAAALRAYGLLAAVATVGIVLVSMLCHPRVFAEMNWYAFFLKLGLYVFGASAQNVFFLAFFLIRLQAIAGLDPAAQVAAVDRRAHARRLWGVSLAAGALFSMLHTPNPGLMAATFVAGSLLARIYCSLPNFLPAVLCHAFMGTLMHRVAGMCMRSGPFYWHRDEYLVRNLLPPLKHWIGNLW